MLLIMGLGWAFDAMDTGIISFIMPLLIAEWGLSSAEMGALGSIGLFGMAIGAVIAGTLADRIGRKRVFTSTMVLYGTATALSAIAPNYELLLLFRFIVGVGLGGELPVAATLLTEFSPQNYRGRFMVLLESFWAVGWLLAALVAYIIIPVCGWRVGLAVGVIPALYTSIIRSHIPESLRYLIRTHQHDRLVVTIKKLESEMNLTLELSPNDYIEQDTAAAQNTMSALWAPRYRKRTLMLWLTWFGIIFSYYGIFMWLPTLIYQQGFTIVKSFEYLVIMTLAQLPGYLTAAVLVDKIGRKPTLAIFLLGSGVSSYFFGHAPHETALIIFGCLLSFFNLGAWGCIYTYTPELYPTAIRGLGSGWAAGIGRVGGILAPLLVGYLLNRHVSVDSVFHMFAAVFALIAVIVILLGNESKNSALEEV